LTVSGLNSGHFDPSKLDDLRALERPGNEGFLVRILAAYLADAERRVKDIENGLEAGDLPAVGMAAHTLKGSSAYVGAVHLAELLKALEEASLAGRAPKSLVDEIEAELASIAELLVREISQHSAK
jgi:HPt (histidine-containing phosphotransfer) domain-containing protein